MSITQTKSFAEKELMVGYRGSTNLKTPDTQIQWTPELIEEFIKCKNDPIYFGQNYMKIVSVDEGLIPIDMYDYQKDLVLSVKNNRSTVAECARQSGKCVKEDAFINIRNSRTGEIKRIMIGEFYELCAKTQTKK